MSSNLPFPNLNCDDDLKLGTVIRNDIMVRGLNVVAPVQVPFPKTDVGFAQKPVKEEIGIKTDCTKPKHILRCVRKWTLLTASNLFLLLQSKIFRVLASTLSYPTISRRSFSDSFLLTSLACCAPPSA